MGWETAAAWLVCPLCHPDAADAGLTAAGASLRCARGHAFDIAADGHVNLLPATRRLPDTVGDNKAMLQARRRFLEQGHYAPLSDALNRVVDQHVAHRLTAPVADSPIGPIPAGSPIAGNPTEGNPPSGSQTSGGQTVSGQYRGGIAILDVGCGEGYYLRRLRQHLVPSVLRTPVHTFGMDVAKAGVSLAARRDARGHFVVADGTVRLPFATRSMQVLLSVFAPRNAAEFGRVLAPGGLLLVVIPLPDHLREARAVVPLLAIEADKERRIVQRLAGGFRHAETTPLEYVLRLTRAALADLAAMTPQAVRHAPAPATPEAVGELRTTVAFSLLTFYREG